MSGHMTVSSSVYAYSTVVNGLLGSLMASAAKQVNAETVHSVHAVSQIISLKSPHASSLGLAH